MPPETPNSPKADPRGSSRKKNKQKMTGLYKMIKEEVEKHKLHKRCLKGMQYILNDYGCDG
ncbi:hypothetical protein H920_14743 [Fukomys damarensis]|uniref:Uncharacterized protein n=1 Tax=Fukomys damarensis TaxID=885580 RepID=A0A091CYS0_FUKDA|nr:hypothetical protein H920_14743 [Fukomys damarensis]